MNERNLPVFCEIPDPKAARNVKHVIRDALCDREVFAKVEPLLLNGEITGHKVGDALEIVTILLDNPTYGPRLRTYGMKKWPLAQRTLGVIRERYELDNRYKAVGVSKRVAALMSSAAE